MRRREESRVDYALACFIFRFLRRPLKEQYRAPDVLFRDVLTKLPIAVSPSATPH
jgi:hypothetical protein